MTFGLTGRMKAVKFTCLKADQQSPPVKANILFALFVADEATETQLLLHEDGFDEQVIQRYEILPQNGLFDSF